MVSLTKIIAFGLLTLIAGCISTPTPTPTPIARLESRTFAFPGYSIAVQVDKCTAQSATIASTGPAINVPTAHQLLVTAGGQIEGLYRINCQAIRANETAQCIVRSSGEMMSMPTNSHSACQGSRDLQIKRT